MTSYSSTGVEQFAPKYTANTVNVVEILSGGNLKLNPNGDIDISGKRIINAANPTDPTDSVTKSYADDTYITAPTTTVTDGAIVIYDGTDGKSVKDSELTINGNAISSSNGDVVLSSDVLIAGNLKVTGDTTIIDVEHLLVSDNAISLNNGYKSTTNKPGGIISNCSATTTWTGTANSFIPGVAGVSNPQVSVNDDVFVAGDIIQISNSSYNNGIYEVHSNSGNTLVIRGVGVTSITYDIFQSQFVEDTMTAYVYKINITAIYFDGTTTYQLTGNNTTTITKKPMVTATNAAANIIPVFSDTSGTLSNTSSEVEATINRPIVVDVPGGTGTGNLYKLQSARTGAVQMTLYNTHASSSGAGITFGAPLVSGTSRTWAFNCGVSTNDFWLWKNSGVNRNNVIYVGDNGLVSAPFGFTSTRYDLTTTASNPGSTGTLWFDGTSLGIGSNKVLTGVPVNNALPVLSATGVITTASSTTQATLSRPLVITHPAGGGAVPLTLQCDSAGTGVRGVRLAIYNTNATNNRAYFDMGKNGSGYEFGTDRNFSGDTDFYLFRTGTGGGNIFVVDNNAGSLQRIVRFEKGVNAPRYDVTASAANPGDTLTLWTNSADSNRQYVGTNKLAYVSDISVGISASSPTTNGLVSFADSTPGNIKSPNATVTSTQSLVLTKTTTTTDTLLSLRRAGTNTAGINIQVLPSSDISSVHFNGYQDVSSGPVYHVAGKSRWSVTHDASGANDTFKVERLLSGTTITPISINTSGISSLLGASSSRYDLISSASNPGGGDTIWRYLSEIKIGNLDVPRAYSANVSFTVSNTTDATPLSVNYYKIGKMLFLHIPAFDRVVTSNGAVSISGPTGGPTNLLFNGSPYYYTTMLYAGATGSAAKLGIISLGNFLGAPLVSLSYLSSTLEIVSNFTAGQRVGFPVAVTIYARSDAEFDIQ